MPDKSRYHHTVEISSKTEADKYIRLGWEIISAHSEIDPGIYADGQTNIIYKLGWPPEDGEPLKPPDTGDLPKIDRAPSPN